MINNHTTEEDQSAPRMQSKHYSSFESSSGNLPFQLENVLLQEGNDPLLTIKSEQHSIVGIEDRNQIRLGRPGGGIQSAQHMGRKKRMNLSTQPKSKADP